MNDYSLTVIIPNYNKEKYLNKCIESVLNQSLQPDEIIVVDDVSTDNSRTILKELQDKHAIVRAIFLEQNGGVSNARNVGLMNAETEYVTFLDSDDYYFNKNKLRNEMSLIKDYDKKGIDVISYSAVVRVSDEENIIYMPDLKKEKFLNGKIYYSILAERKAGKEPRDYCVKRNLILNVGAYSYPKNYFEDLDLIIRLSQKAMFVFAKDYGTAYRDTPAGLSKRSPDEFNEAIKSIRNLYINDITSLKERSLLYREQKLKTIERTVSSIKLKIRRITKGV